MKIDMKKMNIGAFVVSGGLLLAASGCTESDFDSKYEDPSKVNQVTISNLMVGVFQKVKDYDVYEYGRFFGFDSQFVGKYAQTFGYSYSGGMYSPGYTPAIDGQWDNLYSALTQYRKWSHCIMRKTTLKKRRTRRSCWQPKCSCMISLLLP